MNTYPRETAEFQEVRIDHVTGHDPDGSEIWERLADNDPLWATTKVQITTHSGRPVGTWADPYVLDGVHGVWIAGLPAGVHRIWARVSDNPEAPVIDCGEIVST